MKHHGLVYTLFLILLLATIGVFGWHEFNVASSNHKDRQVTVPAVLATDPRQGPDNAKITILEYGDFQCPLCAALEPTMKAILAEYGTQVRLVWKDLPVAESHAWAEAAAEAARCAQQQDAFWQMHDALFADQDKFSHAYFLQLAHTLGLDSAKFRLCLERHQTAALVADAVSVGRKAGVDGAPYVYVNNIVMPALTSQIQIENVINQLLSRSK